MNKALRSVGAVVVGVLAASAVIALVEMFAIPLMSGSPESGHAGAPGPATLGVVLAAWAIGTCVGAWVAARVAGRSRAGHALVVGALLLLAAIANMLTIPHPVWFWVVSLPVFVPAALLGARLAGSGTRPGMEP